MAGRIAVRLTRWTQQVDATPSNINLLFKGGVYGPRETGGLSAAQETDVWCRWKAGQSLHMIGRAFGKPHTSIHCLLSHHGGIVPAVRRRSLLALTLAEREDISRGIACGSSIRDIAKHLERAASTVSREVARHGGRPEYRATEADHQAWSQPCGPRRAFLPSM
ncbi:MAG: integrase catalytic subunit [Candidatus Acidoferrum typicum]|nr:integrase catalytic subunit [Candidatus Acidoferrum typicum]